MVTSTKVPATESFAADQQINPGNSIFKIFVGFSRNLKELLKRGKAKIICVYIGIGDALKLELCPDDQTSQAKTTNRSLKKPGVFAGRTDELLPIGTQKLE